MVATPVIFTEAKQTEKVLLVKINKFCLFFWKAEIQGFLLIYLMFI